jgi:hypothetical protein
MNVALILGSKSSLLRAPPPNFQHQALDVVLGGVLHYGNESPLMVQRLCCDKPIVLLAGG